MRSYTVITCHLVGVESTRVDGYLCLANHDVDIVTELAKFSKYDSLAAAVPGPQTSPATTVVLTQVVLALLSTAHSLRCRYPTGPTWISFQSQTAVLNDVLRIGPADPLSSDFNSMTVISHRDLSKTSLKLKNGTGAKVTASRS